MAGSGKMIEQRRSIHRLLTSSSAKTFERQMFCPKSTHVLLSEFTLAIFSELILERSKTFETSAN